MHHDAPSINIDGTSHPILCGICKTPVAFAGEANSETAYVACPRCRDIFKAHDAAQIAVEYVKHEAQMILNRAARDAASNSKFMTFKGKTAHNQRYRFIVELK